MIQTIFTEPCGVYYHEEEFSAWWSLARYDRRRIVGGHYIWIATMDIADGYHRRVSSMDIAAG
jgi:hypothetical protein